MFIPKKSRIGSRVRLICDVEVLKGTFTKGHELTVTENAGIRGWNLIDDNGEVLNEVFSDKFEIIG